MLAFMPQPGIEQCITELQHRNPQSTKAIIWALNDFTSGVRTDDQRFPATPYADWRLLAENQETLDRLMLALVEAIDTLGGFSVVERAHVESNDMPLAVATSLGIRVFSDAGMTLAERPPFAEALLRVALKQELALANGELLANNAVGLGGGGMGGGGMGGGMGGGIYVAPKYVIPLPVLELLAHFPDEHLPNLILANMLDVSLTFSINTGRETEADLLLRLDQWERHLDKCLQRDRLGTIAAIGRTLGKCGPGTIETARFCGREKVFVAALAHLLPILEAGIPQLAEEQQPGLQQTLATWNTYLESSGLR
jgi:hypothetical protein